MLRVDEPAQHGRIAFALVGDLAPDLRSFHLLAIECRVEAGRVLPWSRTYPSLRLTVVVSSEDRPARPA